MSQFYIMFLNAHADSKETGAIQFWEPEENRQVLEHLVYMPPVISIYRHKPPIITIPEFAKFCPVHHSIDLQHEFFFS